MNRRWFLASGLLSAIPSFRIGVKPARNIDSPIPNDDADCLAVDWLVTMEKPMTRFDVVRLWWVPYCGSDDRYPLGEWKCWPIDGTTEVWLGGVFHKNERLGRVFATSTSPDNRVVDMKVRQTKALAAGRRYATIPEQAHAEFDPEGLHPHAGTDRLRIGTMTLEDLLNWSH